MNLQALKADIQTKKLSNFYIFIGPEWIAQNMYIKQIAKVMGNAEKRIDSISKVYMKLKNKSFLTQSYIYVARDDKEFMESEKLQNEIPKVLGDNIYILILTNVDKRTKIYKKYQSNMVEFEYFDDKVLTKYIQKEIDLSPANCKKLIDVCESDYGRILLEIDKIKQYAKGFVGDYGPNNFFSMLLNAGVIYRPPKDAIFDFVNAVMDRSTKCWDLLNQSYAVGEANMVLLSVLYNNFKQVLQVQSCKSADISKSTGLTGWQIKCAKEHLNNYSNGELVHAMKLIQEVESGIKTGKIEDEISVQYVLVNVL